jgi:hypothetical protein
VHVTDVVERQFVRRSDDAEIGEEIAAACPQPECVVHEP